MPNASVSSRRPETLSLPSAYPQPTLSLPSAYPLILSHPARGDGGGGGDAAAGELDGDFARGISAAPGGLRSPMPLEATQAEALHTCRTVYSLILSCRLVALLLLAVRVMASRAKKPSKAQERRRQDLRPRWSQTWRSRGLSSAYPQPTLSLPSL